MHRCLHVLVLAAALTPTAALAWPPSWVAESNTANVYRSTDQGSTWQQMAGARFALLAHEV